MSRRLPKSVRSIAAVALIVLLPTVAHAQVSWEYSPYEVRVRLAISPEPQLAGNLPAVLGQAVLARAEAVVGAAWHVEAAAASAKLQTELLSGVDKLTAANVAAAADAGDLAADKLYLVAIGCLRGEVSLALRELDCRTQQLGPVCRRVVPDARALAGPLWDALWESFTPLARIEMVEDEHVTCRLRAAGLVTDLASPALVEAGMVLQPILRRTDRGGQLAKGGIQVVPWTLLSAVERRESLVDCTLQSGYRAALPTRNNSRVERLALLVKPHWPATQLLLRARDNPEKPLSGYEIHIRKAGEEQPKLLGVTDASGGFSLPRGDGAPWQIFIRNGNQLLAKLPIVPGQEESVTARIVDDDRRLEAEGFIAALASRAVDLVARREILAARIRARLKAGTVSEAQQLLDEFRKLETRADLNRDMDQFRQRVTINIDKLTRTRIDALFTEAQKLLLLRALSDELLGQLTREVTQAQSGGQ